MPRAAQNSSWKSSWCRQSTRASALRAQQASAGVNEVRGRQDPALRARRDLSVRDRVRPAAEWPVVDGLHRAARLRRLPGGPARLRQVHAPARDGQARRGQRADRAHRDRGQGRRRGGGLHPQAPRRLEDQPAGLVVGHLHHGLVHRAEQRQGEQAGALCAAMDSQHRRR